jgi:hypothetical protein
MRKTVQSFLDSLAAGQAPRVAWVITVGSTNYTGQSDRVNAIQFLWVLSLRGVQPDDVYAWLPEDTDTVKRPRPYFGLPPLNVPPEYEGRVIKKWSGMTRDIIAELSNIRKRTDIAFVTWIFMNHGTDETLEFPGDQRIRVREIREVCSDVTISMPLIVILDACCSTNLARKVLFGPKKKGSRGKKKKTILQGRDVAFLTSAMNLAYTSCIVLCEDPSFADATEDGIQYAIYGSMFVRKFLHMICYGNSLKEANPCLKDLPGLLNVVDPAISNGFCAELITSCENMKNLPIRVLFGGRIDGASEIPSNANHPFDEIVPFGPFLDDIPPSTRPTDDKINFDFYYVKLQRTASLEVVIDEEGELAKDDATQLAIRNHIQTTRSQTNRSPSAVWKRKIRKLTAGERAAIEAVQAMHTKEKLFVTPTLSCRKSLKRLLLR